MFRLLILTLSFAACAPSVSRPITPGMCSPQILTRIYFGADTPAGSVSDEQWSTFLRETVTPAFPSGLSVVDSEGQWLGEDKRIVRERSRILELIHADDPVVSGAIDKIALGYKNEFRQEAVLVLHGRVDACLE